MLKLSVVAGIVAAALCSSVWAGDTYTLHENLHVGQQVTYVITQEAKQHTVDIADNGKQNVNDRQTGQSWTVTETVLAVADGSATQARVDVAAGSFDTVKVAGQDEKKTACPFIGRSILLTRKPDGSVADDYPRPPSASDLDTQNGDGILLDNLLTPDEQSYPDRAVAVGDTWDMSAKLAKAMGLGPKDHLTATSKLDWVKEIGGKQIAQISCNEVITYHIDAGPNGLVAQDTVDTSSDTMLVDIAAGMIVKDDSKDVTKTQGPGNSPPMFVDVNEAVFHAEVKPDLATTQP
jgi:hypothetical protein